MQTMIRKSVELFKPCDKQMNLQDKGHKLKTLSQKVILLRYLHLTFT